METVSISSAGRWSSLDQDFTENPQVAFFTAGKKPITVREIIVLGHTRMHAVGSKQTRWDSFFYFSQNTYLNGGTNCCRVLQKLKVYRSSRNFWNFGGGEGGKNPSRILKWKDTSFPAKKIFETQTAEGWKNILGKNCYSPFLISFFRAFGTGLCPCWFFLSETE